MSTAIDAIYENGLLRPLGPLPFAENTRVHLSVEPVSDPERAAWLSQSERSLTATWANDADDVFNELLS
jgi:predicted DNA-binding antitoxin AbrB/MazE fold protein